MYKNELEGIRFGFKILFVWLILLTGFVMYDKMSIGNRGISQTILLPPPVQDLEVIDYGINE